MASKRKRRGPKSIIQKLTHSFQALRAWMKRMGKKMDNIDMGQNKAGGSMTEGEQNRLIMAHTGLVAPIASDYRGRKGIPFEDLCSEGMVGLVEAARSYSPSHGTKFSSWATQRIRGAILNSIDQWKPTIPLEREDEVESRVFEPHAAWDGLPATPEQIRLLFEETAHRTAAVEAALIGLAPKERRMVEAHFLDKPKIGIAQIARDHGCSYYIAVNTIYRAVKKMRETIQRMENNQSVSPTRTGRPRQRQRARDNFPDNVIPINRVSGRPTNSQAGA